MVYAYHEQAGEQLLHLHGSLYWPDSHPASLRHLWSEEGVPESELNTDNKNTPVVGVLSVSLKAPTEVHAKTHHISDPEHEDLDIDLDTYWAGVLPIHQTYGAPEPDKRAKAKGTAVPESVKNLVAGNGGV